MTYRPETRPRLATPMKVDSELPMVSQQILLNKTCTNPTGHGYEPVPVTRTTNKPVKTITSTSFMFTTYLIILPEIQILA
jgi:hypothetical protein